jgi:hypothetical protein
VYEFRFDDESRPNRASVAIHVFLAMQSSSLLKLNPGMLNSESTIDVTDPQALS